MRVGEQAGMLIEEVGDLADEMAVRPVVIASSNVDCTVTVAHDLHSNLKSLSSRNQDRAATRSLLTSNDGASHSER